MQGTRTLFTSDPAWAVGVRMLPLSSSTLYRDVLRLILAPLLIMLGVNLAMAYVGLTSFIKPLEDLAKKLKSGGKVKGPALHTISVAHVASPLRARREMPARHLLNDCMGLDHVPATAGITS